MTISTLQKVTCALFSPLQCLMLYVVNVLMEKLHSYKQQISEQSETVSKTLPFFMK